MRWDQLEYTSRRVPTTGSSYYSVPSSITILHGTRLLIVDHLHGAVPNSFSSVMTTSLMRHDKTQVFALGMMTDTLRVREC